MTTTEQPIPPERLVGARRGAGGPLSIGRAPITRKPIVQRRMTGRLLLVIALAAVAIGVAVGRFFSSLLAIRVVEVNGLSTVPKETVIDAAGIKIGQPLARLDTGDATSRVADIPAVAHVEVTRQWPHTVVLTVTERKPAIAVPHGTAYAIYDATGVSSGLLPPRRPAYRSSTRTSCRRPRRSPQC